MAFSFFKKNQEKTPLESFISDLSAWLSQNEGQTVTVFQLNELLRKNELYQIVYYATSGFQMNQLQPVLDLTVKPNASQLLDKISLDAWQEQLAATDPDRSPLNALFTSTAGYFKLRLKKTAFQISLELLQGTFPKMPAYQKDKKTGEFVMNTMKELLYACYRLDLGRSPQFEEKNLSLAELQPPATLLPLQGMLQKINLQPLNEVDSQYLFTWLLQYSATIATASAVFASYSSAALPESILSGSQAVVQELSNKAAALNLTQSQEAADSLALSQRLLDELPRLYQEANDQMTALDEKLSSEESDSPADEP